MKTKRSRFNSDPLQKQGQKLKREEVIWAPISDKYKQLEDHLDNILFLFSYTYADNC